MNDVDLVLMVVSLIGSGAFLGIMIGMIFMSYLNTRFGWKEEYWDVVLIDGCYYLFSKVEGE